MQRPMIFNATICRPQVAYKHANRRRRLLEYFRWNALLIRPQSPNSQASQPFRNCAMNVMRVAACRSEIDLIPIALLVDARLDLIAEDFQRQLGDYLSKVFLFRGVLSRVARQRAAVTDEMTEQCQLIIRHALPNGIFYDAWKGKMFADRQFIKPLPSPEHSEFMIRRRANCTPQPGGQPEHRLDACCKSPADDRRFESEIHFVQSPHLETRIAVKIANRDLRAAVGHRH